MTRENIIQRGELNLRLARGLEIRQRAGEGLLLADQVVPCVTLEDLTKQSLAVEPGERRAFASSGLIAAGGAGFFGAASLFNPVGSGTLLVVRGFNASTNATGQHVFGIGDGVTNAPANPVAPFWNDARTTGIPLGIVKQGTPAASPVLTELTRITVGTTTIQSAILWPPDFSVVLVEGQSFVGVDAVANQATTISFIWDEIPLR